MPTADVTSFCDGESIEYSYEYEADHSTLVARPILYGTALAVADGSASAYRRNGKPVARGDVPAHVRVELWRRLPDEEHGWTWRGL